MSSPSTSTSASGSSPGALPGLAKFGCINCREQHLKCDRVTPTCGRCQSSGRACRPTGLKIRVNTENGKFKFTRKQKWVKFPKRYVWIDETNIVGHDQSSPESGTEDFDVDLSNYAASPELASPGVATVPRSATLSQLSSVPPESKHSPGDLVIVNRFVVDDHPSATEQQAFAVKAPLVGIEEPCKWPLPQGTEGHLIRHFVENLALWLDLCDPNQSFQIEVPRRAGKSSILRDAMLALSARHQANTCRSYYEELAKKYNERCIENITKLATQCNPLGLDWLIDHEPRLAENCFAAAIILRVMEEMQESRTLSMDDQENNNRVHLDGIRAYTNSYVSRHKGLAPGTLAAASFWVGLRQDIYYAVMKKTTVKLSLVSALPSKDPYEDLEDDYYWANRAVVHCANVLNFCHGDVANRTPERWDLLVRENENWAARMGRGDNRPTTLREESDFWVPYVRENDDTKPFPEIWYLRSCQVIGMQHFLLASAFLFSNEPEIRMAPSDTVEALTQRIQALVREICGIGLGNKSIAPSMFTACMAIAAFGDLFGRPQDQSAMLIILDQTEKDHARPTLEVQQQMKKAWRWR
ncbi:hypothetical protein QBC40DRAFT_5220 [Triangularia verruculosa]|uniref:Zn(2)-C6 fungal-type domain-containing protein n=1 Tax=Triangularia verruculosa TaxID=2587418 RepID=A0AAN6XA87_9PEZI|nr:hypothetical protein QBC40DRAFT_5220 [Triangularia verruculosa]